MLPVTEVIAALKELETKPILIELRILSFRSEVPMSFLKIIVHGKAIGTP